jgi:hypothetical protein
LALLLCHAAGCGTDSGGPADAGVDAVPLATLTHDQLLEACVRLSACEIERHPFLRDCANNFYDRYAAYGQGTLFQNLFVCANQGGWSCKAIRECFGFAGRPKACDKSYPTECRGEVAYACDLVRRENGEEGWEQALDCRNGGLRCAVKETGTTRVAVCGGGACDSAAAKPECRDRRLLNCIGGALEINDCPAQQLQCRDPFVAGCEGTGRSCAATKAICKGSVLTKCQHGYLQEIDCAKLPGKKVCDALTASCKGSGTECSMDADFDACEGDSLAVCLDGYKKKYDCKAMGFLGCTKSTAFGAYCKAEPVYQ